MKHKYIPENLAKPLQNDCVELVKDNLGVKIKRKDVDVMSPNFNKTFNLIVDAMRFK